MGENTTQRRAKRSFKPAVAWVVIIGYTAFLGMVGFVIGELFFWKVKYNTGNKQALMMASERLAKNPEDVEAILNMGWAYYQNGQFNQALAEYSKALTKDPDHVGLRVNMGLTYLQMGKLDLAEENFKNVLAADGKNTVAMMNLALVHQEKKNFDKAVELLQQAYKLNRGSAEILYQLGHTFDLKGDKKQAEFYYSEALRFSPNLEKVLVALEKIKGEEGIN